LHPVIGSLYTQFSALCLRLDERLETLEQRVLHRADDQELAEITTIRHRAAVLRRTVTPGRDLAARMPLILSLPGTTSDTQLYADDISDELQQIVADLTAIGERCVALLALHASLASKHLATVSRRLAAVATIFLAHLLSRRILGTELQCPHGQHRKGVAGVPAARRGTERGLCRRDRLHPQPSQMELRPADTAHAHAAPPPRSWLSARHRR
jgi:magnesium transporter